MIPDIEGKLSGRRSAGVLGCLVLLLTVAGCGRHGKAAPVGGSDLPPSQVKLKRNVELGRVEQRPLDYVVETVGYLEAEGQSDLAAGVTGIVDEVLFREGQWVDRDTILVKVDQPRYLAARDQALANEKRAEVSVALAKELDRIARNAREGTSQEDKAKTAQGLRITEAELLGARAARVMAEHNLHRSRVRAPYAGQMNQRKITAGMYLEEKTIIGTIADLSRLRLVGWVPEKAAPTVMDLMLRQERMRSARLAAASVASPWAGMAGLLLDMHGALPSDFSIEFTLLPYPKRTFRGRVFYLSTVASPDTHMFECKVEVNTLGLDVTLRPGLTAQIRVPLRGNPTACIIPEESVRASERGFIAFVPMLEKDDQGRVRPGKDGQPSWVARARTLELGFRSPGWVEVLQGLSPGESIVRKGAEALEDGTPIQFPEAPGK